MEKKPEQAPKGNNENNKWYNGKMVEHFFIKY